MPNLAMIVSSEFPKRLRPAPIKYSKTNPDLLMSF